MPYYFIIGSKLGYCCGTGARSVIMHLPPHPVTFWVIGSSKAGSRRWRNVYQIVPTETKICRGVCVVGELESAYSRCPQGPRPLSPLVGPAGPGAGPAAALLGPALPSARPALRSPGPGWPWWPRRAGRAWRARRPGGPCGAGGARWTGTPDLGQQTPERGAHVGGLVEIVALQGDITAAIEADGIGLRVRGAAIPGALEE